MPLQLQMADEPPPEPTITTAPPTPPPPPAAHGAANSITVPPKRQRRPSVRLGEIGDQGATTVGHDSQPTRRPSVPPWSWRIVKGNHSSKGSQDFEERNNVYEEFGNRKAKAKRGSTTTTKRARSNLVPRNEEGFGDFDHSPVQSVDDEGFGEFWHRHGVSENDCRDRKCGTSSEGVRSWLVELGLSRYAPMFEMHEVDDELLPMLTLEDLKDMGINAVGSRRKMYTSIQKLRKGFP